MGSDGRVRVGGSDSQPGAVTPNKGGKRARQGLHQGRVEVPDARKPNAYRGKFKEDDDSVVLVELTGTLEEFQTEMAAPRQRSVGGVDIL